LGGVKARDVTDRRGVTKNKRLCSSTGTPQGGKRASVKWEDEAICGKKSRRKSTEGGGGTEFQEEGERV